ncbi:uncharacterized protein Fot_34186 [Forsythia ovata]|uniref:Uncharacterized protein n=1 Tax=Forsythia ovata TaxID=205694 RepID=A0ABD1SIZ2_9LAMI
MGDATCVYIRVKKIDSPNVVAAIGLMGYNNELSFSNWADISSCWTIWTIWKRIMLFSTGNGNETGPDESTLPCPRNPINIGAIRGPIVSPLKNKERILECSAAKYKIGRTENHKVPSTNLVPELRNEPEGEEQLSPNTQKRVTFDSNVTTYKHVLVEESTESLQWDNKSVEKEKEEGSKM